MRHFISLSLLVLAFGAQAALAQDTPDLRTAETLLPHCTAALAAEAQDLAGARCLGIIATLSFVSRVLPDNLKFCQPPAATPEIIIHAIASFAEANPESNMQDFRLVALAAMRNKWPCEE